MAGADEQNGTTRRRVLRTGAAALAGGLAGCGGDGSGAGNPTSAETATVTGTLTATPTPPASVSGTYRSFQYDAANAGSADAEGPTGTVGRLWRHREAALGPAHAVGSPAVADGTLYVAEGGRPPETGTGDEASVRTTLFALDAATGAVQWDVTFEGTNAIGETAVGGEVVLLRLSGTLFAVDAASGERRWSLSTDLDAGPTVAGNTAYVVGKGYSGPATLYALSLPDGDVLWTYDLAVSGGQLTPPAVADGTVYVGGNELHAVAAADGSERWRVATEDGVFAAPTVVGDRIFLDAGDRSAEARAVSDGERLWRQDLPIDGVAGGPTVASPAVADGRAFVVTAWMVTALDAATGDEEWHTPVDGTHPPVVAGDEVFVGGLDTLTALDADSGEKRWRYRTNASSGGGRKPPVVLDGVAYVASAGLHAVGGTGD